MPHPQVGEATALVQVGEVAGEVHGVRLVDVDIRFGARRRGGCACAGLLRGVLHFANKNIRHWEVTARVQKAFLSFFWICLLICLIFLIFLLRSRARPDLAADSGCRRVRRARGRL